MGTPYYSIVDVVVALTENGDAGNYWRVTKSRLKKEGGQGALQNVTPFALPTEGGPQKTDCTDIKTLLRLIQSIPSKKAEPFKLWLAQVGYERIEEIAEPDKASTKSVNAHSMDHLGVRRLSRSERSPCRAKSALQAGV